MTDLEKKVSQSVRLIRSIHRCSDIVIAYSGGKDSDVVRSLCIEAGVPFRMVYNSTTVDPPYTISRNISLGAYINRPKRSFLQLIEKKGLPSMFRRFCCSVLKEQYIAPRLLLGIRCDESVRRKNRYVEPSACRVFTKYRHCDQIYPIIHWDTNDIQEYIEGMGIKLHPLYYTDGKFDVSKRLGCLGCPLQGDRGRHDFLQYPKLLRQWVRAYAKYVQTHKCIEGLYEDILWHIFYSNHGNDEYQQNFHGLFTAPNAKSLLEDYFRVDLTI